MSDIVLQHLRTIVAISPDFDGIADDADAKLNEALDCLATAQKQAREALAAMNRGD